MPRQLSYHEYLALRDHNRSLRQLAAFSYFPAMIGDDDPGGNPGHRRLLQFLSGREVSTAPSWAACSTPRDCEAPGQAPAAVISEKTWHTRFASDPHIVGRGVRLNNRPVTVVGVVPDLTTGWFTAQRSGFRTPRSPTWIPRAMPSWMRMCFGFPSPGVSRRAYSRSQAQAEFNILEHQEDRQHPGRSTAVVTTDGSWLEEFELNMSARDLMLLAFFLGSFISSC